VITSKNYKDEVCVLIDQATGRPLTTGQLVTTSRGEQVSVKGGRAPHKPSSEGKVWVNEPGFPMGSEFYASVIGAEWILLDDLMITPKRGAR